ncbi:transporter substrate-binding domain-containing protein [bacterium]|nr:transporter substrate-binding domain-containing protein [bacterium]
MVKGFLLVLLVMFFGFSLVKAEENVMIKVFTEQNPPYNWEENGEIKGFSTQIVREILKRAGFKYSMRCVPWSGAYQTTIKHENTLIFSIVRMENRESLFKWVGPFAPYQVFLFKLKSRKDINISSLKEAKRYRIGVVENDARHLYFQEKGGYKLDVVREDILNIKKLFVERIDLIPFKEITLKKRVNDLAGHSFDELEKVLLLDEISSDFYAAFGEKTSDEIVKKCQNALNSMKKDGTFNEIASQHVIPGL